MANTFAGAIDKWVMETKARQEAVFKASALAVSKEIIDRMSGTSPHVITGFLRASFTASLVEPPQIDPDAYPPKGAGKNSFPPPTNYSLVINSMKLGDTYYAGFVAAYSAHVEYGTHGRPGARMVGLSVQNWPQHVANAVRAAKASVASRSK
ncbi:hypothetical protein [Reyranella sp.]|uniref:hypothetical protein n=1 Tax=Reyranella sp. TaxID=1929291 RepID=UPI00403656E6